MAADCLICKKHSGLIQTLEGSVIYEDEHVYVGHLGARSGEQLAYLGYVMVELKRHAPGFGDLTAEEAAAVGIAANEVSRALKEALHAEHVYAFVQGDGVPHFHMHLIPRYPGTPTAYWNPMKLADWPDAPRGGEVDVLEVCSRLLESLRLRREA
ncbi:HIT family protein [Paenibacillus silvisoli]|uniref:HIT family protein n=1 Tax=Paenibacillus silvisoli TaxID=3110539 RepID=UPI002805FB23|nr:HIT family protein [Paenibacillus silvisoli]